jgi:putative acetyltransferase
MTTIRLAHDTDGPAIAALIAKVFAEYEDCPFLPAEFPELAAPASHYTVRNGALWVAEAGDRIVGSFALYETWDKGIFALAKVYLALDCRGNGIAADFLSRAEAFAAERGGQALTLWSDTRFASGHAFYRKHGFQQEAGVRQLHDVAKTVEFRFCRPIGAGAR